jgi:Ser/Thr protein kinase RdoA (MazF antagonist)
MPFLPRTPAWSALNPGPPSFSRIDDRRRDLLRAAVGERADVWKMGADDGTLGGFYRLDAVEPLFLKVVPGDHLERQSRAADVARHVAGHDVATPVPLDAYPRNLVDGYALFAFPYLDARFATSSLDDLQAIGALLARLHLALSDAPRGAEVSERSSRRDAYLEELRRRVVEGRGLLPEFHDVLSAGTTVMPEAGPPQAIHGDLNVANVMFPLAGGGPLILDFEDCAHSWHAPLLDVAMALERFVLVRTDDEDDTVKRCEGLLEGYREIAPLVIPPGSLVAILTALSSRAMVLLAALESAGQWVAPDEWDKFCFLTGLARRRAPALARLEAP